MHLSQFYTVSDNSDVICQLCPHLCRISPGKKGICKVRSNAGGKLISDYYGKLSAVAIDPIEKKPLYHFFPGSDIVSIGSIGCNMSCQFCQNAGISQYDGNNGMALQAYSSLDIVKKSLGRNQGFIAYTYNEPTVFFEFMLDTAQMAKKHGIKNVMVTNGYINSDPLDELLNYIDAFNIDLKAFNNNFYRKTAKARLEPVLDTIKRVRHYNTHLELTFLAIPGLNDNIKQFKEMVLWIKENCGEDQVLHISRYFPKYKMNLESTDLELIIELMAIAGRQLNYVYPGNTGLSLDSNTYCPKCRSLLIERNIYSVRVVGLYDGKCSNCDNMIGGTFF